MANIRVDSAFTIFDGQTLTFKSPADCSQVTGLIVYYPDRLETASKVFQLTDANGNNVGNINNLFAADAIVKVVLDVDESKAFVQNADTNAYLEAQLASKAPAGFGLGGFATEPVVGDFNNYMKNGSYIINTTVNIANRPDERHEYGYGVLHVFQGSQVTVQEVVFPEWGWGFVNFITLQRVCTLANGTEWSPWEYVDPPMIHGAEYRTTERFNRKAVYKRIYNSRLGGGIEYRLEGETDYKPYAVAVGAYAKSFSYMPENTSLLSWAENLNASGSFIVGPSNTDTPNTGSSYWICQLYHQGTDRILLECTDITGGNLNSTFYNMRIDNSWCGWKRRATIFNTTATIPATGWTANGAGVKQTVSVPGISWKDDPVVGDVITDNQVTNITIKEAWNCVSYIVCEDNAITLFCDGGTPAVDIPIKIQCVR